MARLKAPPPRSRGGCPGRKTSTTRSCCSRPTIAASRSCSSRARRRLNAGRSAEAELLNTLTAALNVHEAIEEKVLYPALKPHAEAHDIVLEGYQEHHVADLIIRELHKLAKNDEKWGAKFKVLEENIAHHIEEEERKMFPTARAVLTTEELNDLGARMKALKAKLEKRNGGR